VIILLELIITYEVLSISKSVLYKLDIVSAIRSEMILVHICSNIMILCWPRHRENNNYDSIMVCLDETIQEVNSFIWRIWNSFKKNYMFVWEN